MANPDMDVIKEIPGYRVILKAVLKSQIQQLIEQLAASTDEESIILTASVADGTLSHLGSDSAKGFLEDHEDVKSQFLGYCLKSHHKRNQEKEREEQEAAIRKAQQEALSYAQPMMPMGPRMPRFSPRQPFRAMGPGVRHQPYQVNRPTRGRKPSSSPSLKSPARTDGQVVKSEPVDRDETSNQSGGDGAPNSSQPTSPSAGQKGESGDNDDAQSNTSASNIPNETGQEGLALGSDYSTLMSGANDNPQSDSADDGVNVKVEALSDSEMESEITGVEPGHAMMPQDWGGNFDPNTSGATGSPGDMAAQQGYSPESSFSSESPNKNIRKPKTYGSFLFCEVCNKAQQSRSHYLRHVKTHTGEKPFSCDFCGYRCSRKDNLRIHLRNIHKVDTSVVGLQNNGD